jgi:predicted nucleotidyltransferase
MSTINLQKDMLITVASALGEELINDVVFVGGCTTGLLVTDDFTKEQIRYTDDVDLVVDIMGYPAWARLQENLRSQGFRDPMDLDGGGVICRMLLGELQVDFMPTDAATLGFGNRWYTDSVRTAQNYPLTEDVNIKLIRPEYFIATKLEAYFGRGNGDLLESRDMEDILNIFDGRESIVQEIQEAEYELKCYVQQKLSEIITEYDFEMAVQSTSGGDSAREEMIFERLERCIEQ